MGEHGIESTLTLSGSPTEKVKWWHLDLTNRTNKERRLEVYLFIEWTLGISREESSRYIVSNFDSTLGFLSAKNNYNNEFAGRLVSIGSNLKISSYTTSRHDFIGRHRTTSSPRQFESPGLSAFTDLIPGLRAPLLLSKKTGAGFDSCGVLKVEVNLAPGQKREVLFYLNESESLEEAKRQATRHRSLSMRSSELEKTQTHWKSTLTAVQVRTPDRAFDILMNGWLLYQTLSCRLYGRSAFYQSGGAIGFRDQLQDSLALLYSRSDLTRAQILIHAARQFVEGDVQHWWHPPTGRGVRTRISDDYLWLPYVVCRYLEFTVDYSVLDELVSFIESPKLEEHQMESYTLPHISQKTASIYEHCTLALDRALVFGLHGLPLMGGGDWNDGMNDVGKEGKGESVWLAWFLSHTLRKFAAITRQRDEESRTLRYEEVAQKLVKSIDDNAWDGEWYRRAYFDEGTPLGSSSSDECKIDSLAQSWSVITGGGETQRRMTAMDAVRRELVRSKDKIICLLSPPFDKSDMEPGYIKGYLPGTRENGGQYTHAATWVVMATVLQGKGKEAFELFSLINPINHSLTQTDVQKYQGEPYVLAGDVYSVEPHAGRAGWSWYTGSSSWLYQVGIEYILGLKVKGNYFLMDPVIPSSWKEFSITYLVRNIRYQIEVKNPDGVERGIRRVEVDGENVTDNKILFVDAIGPKERLVRVNVVMGCLS